MGIGERLKGIFKKSGTINFYEEFEDLLIESDIGVVPAMDISKRLLDKFGKRGPENRDVAILEITNILSEMLLEVEPLINKDKTTFLLVLGVNGVGKTTTIAKMAHYYKNKYDVEAILSAGDTFRAAAIDQLMLHGERLGLKVIHQQQGADPGAVIFDSIESAKARGASLVIADTAGRMHNKANLVKELEKINRIIASKAKNADFKKILVIDATTGQNGFRQAEMFHEAVGIDEVVLSKYDSMARGGIALSISSKLKIPFSFVGTGERYSDLEVFRKEDFIKKITG